MPDGSQSELITFTDGLWCPPAWGRRSGLALPRQQTPRHCRWCATLITPPRRAWCSEECVKRYLRVGTWPDLCKLIRERDKVCTNCGGEGLRKLTEHSEFFDRHGQFRPAYTALTVCFEVDHIVTIHDGGSDDPRNLRLLCRPCHKIVTTLWVRRRARLGQQLTLMGSGK